MRKKLVIFTLSLFLSNFLFPQNEIRSTAQLDSLLIKDTLLFEIFDTILSNIEKDSVDCQYIQVWCENNSIIKFSLKDSIFDFDLNGIIVYKNVPFVFCSCEKRSFFTAHSSIKIEVPVYNWNFYLSDGGIITILVEEEEISWSYYYNNAEFKFVEYTNTYKKKEPK